MNEERDFVPGQQVIYHLSDELPEERGFVVQKIRPGFVHCRFWQYNSYELKNVHDNDLVEIRYLRIENSCPQRVVNHALHRLGYDSTISEFEGKNCLITEKMSSLKHIQWAKWITHVINKATKDSNGDYVLSGGLIDAWQRQIDSDFGELSMYEQDMNRRQVFEMIDTVLISQSPELAELFS